MEAVISNAATLASRRASAAYRTWNLGLLFLAGCFLPAILYFGLAYYVNPVRDFPAPPAHPFPAVQSDYRNEKIALLDSFLGDNRGSSALGGIILGSSRSMLLNGERLSQTTGVRVFNFGLASAKGEDFLAALRWLRQRKGQVPKLVVIGLDVESLRDARSLGDSLHPLRELATGSPSTIERLQAVLPRMAAWSYARSVLYSSYLAVRPQQPSVGFAPDGTLQYRMHDRRRQDGTFALAPAMAGCMASCRQKIEDTAALSQPQIEYLKTTVREARDGGAKVVVWLTGPHPQTAAFMSAGTAYPQLLAATRAVLAETAALGATTYDLHDLQTYAGDPNAWYDCNHFDNGNAIRVEQILTSGGGQ